MSGPHIVIHGHFYQPPRENPWTETVGIEPSAAPYHDWNERITAECYRPNTAARIVDDHGLVVSIVNNFELMSFDLGPTLASWLHEHAPRVLSDIIEADRKSGTAIAQAYHHVILPLADLDDVRTEIRWGMAEFEYRFGRRAEGVWLPETAVNEAVLAVLAEEGVRFTILAPGQAVRVRSRQSPDGQWIDVAGGQIDFRSSYLWRHPTMPNLGVELVFYDGALSHDVAFGLASQSAQSIIERANADGYGSPSSLVCIATDGETFGHHHKFSERAVAYAMSVETRRRNVATGRIVDWLDQHPPTHEVQIVESAWSCAHGVGRWKTDCGCATGGLPGWNQQWRAPLREALDELRHHSRRVFDRRGGELFLDARAALDEYVSVMLGAVSIEEFAVKHLRHGADRVDALTLLEAERHALAMYTSCGWFFNDLAGLETVQILRYAARLVDLLVELGEEPPLDRFLDVLARAQSNDPNEGTGLDIWNRHVMSTRVDASRVVGHLALMALLERRDPDDRLANFDVILDGHVADDRGSVRMCAGRVTLRHRRTTRTSVHLYAAVHLGGLEVIGASRVAGDSAADDAALDRFASAFALGQPVSSLVRLLNDDFGAHEFGLDAALPDATVQILESAARELTDRFAAAFERLVSDHQPIFRALAKVGFRLPPELRAPAELALSRRLEADLYALAVSDDRLALREVANTLEEARVGGLNVATATVLAAANRALDALTERAIATGDGEGTGLVALLRMAHTHNITLEVDRAQEMVFDALMRGDANESLRDLGRSLGLAVERLGHPD